MEKYSQLYKFSEIVPVSALTGENLNHLTELVIGYLPAGPKYYPDGMITDKPEKFIISEIIREKVLQATSQEVPHSVTVEIEEVRERPADLVAVRAVIYTERESQKKILIGKNGSMLKEIGKRSGKEMEALFGSRIFLELWVKVKAGWRNNERYLGNFGYFPK
jgi:GTP-binding protein Era